jgi:hypothetical protein
MFEKTTLHELFPMPVWVVDLTPEAHEPLNRGIIEAVNAMTGSRPAIRPGETWLAVMPLRLPSGHLVPPSMAGSMQLPDTTGKVA